MSKTKALAARGGRRAPETLEMLPDPLRELIEIAGRHVRGRRTATAIPRVVISRSETTTAPLPGLCEPSALFVLQGAKSVLIGDRTLRYDPASYFISATTSHGHGIDNARQ
ncbi:MAG: AraC family transcriptional regulator N-terminal domain-containing protein [bacterium]